MAYYQNTDNLLYNAPAHGMPTTNALAPQVPPGEIVDMFGEGTSESPRIGWLRIPRHPDPILAGRVERLAVRAAIKMGKKSFYIRSIPHDSLGYVNNEGLYNRYLGMDWHICFHAGDDPVLADTQGDVFYTVDDDNEFIPMEDECRSDWRNVLPRPLRGIEAYPYPKLNQNENRIRPRGQLPRPEIEPRSPPNVETFDDRESLE